MENKADASVNSKKKSRSIKVKWLLVFYDLLCIVCVNLFLLGLYRGIESLPFSNVVYHGVVFVACIFGARFFLKIYAQIWRYGGIQSYIRLMIADAIGSVLYYILGLLLPIGKISFAQLLALCCMNLILSLALRMLYRYAYKCNQTTPLGKMLCALVYYFTGRHIEKEQGLEDNKIKIAIVGAGRVGVALAEDLFNNVAASYVPKCFVDIRSDKIGREIHGIPVISEDMATFDTLKEYGIQEIVFALPHMDENGKKALYDYYKQSGCKIKVYDYPVIQTAGSSKRTLREFDIEELLFRRTVSVVDKATDAYYKNKVVLITGGGGSIGSELCRQIAKMSPKQLIILDVYENGAYDIQQELRIAYRAKLDLIVEILSVCNRPALERVFAKYRPNIVLNAAAHKHVPLMEHNCCEAVENNVFGTLNTVELSEKYGVEKFIMVSTDKAVNPTNVMGATKRMCEMIVQSHSQMGTGTVFNATRFGNVLGSAGSVIPLFRRQISAGGPVTVTDRRIIRYFMTISEASQLVLQSGAMAKNGELFVLDMGKPVKILDLAENMIKLSGYEPYRDIDIVEIGLRPGEKLYEELLVNSENLDKTSHNMIFIERDVPLDYQELQTRLQILRDAVATGDDLAVRNALHEVVPTFNTPDEINVGATGSQEIKQTFLV